MAGLRVWLRKLLGNREEPVSGAAFMHTREPNSPMSFVEGNNDFALAMYRLLRQSPGNLFFSPFSIRTALGMTQAGAKGETATEMVASGRFRRVADAPVLRQPVYAALHIRNRIAPLHRRLRRVVVRRLAGEEGAVP